MKILLAVSSGIDSMYMLARSEELFPGDSFAVAHCNFALRGQESDGDEQFVRDYCTAAGIPIFVKRFNTKAYVAEHGVSIEMAARDLRYAWFEELLLSEGFDAVAVAHNSNDNAETLLLNLLRGTGSRGLRGMGERTINSSCKVLRPLLGVSRKEIEEWMSEHGIAHREDSSNAGNDYKRNKLRNLVFPVFEQINPSFLRTLNSDMRHFAQVHDIAEDYFEQVKGDVFCSAEGSGATASTGAGGGLVSESMGASVATGSGSMIGFVPGFQGSICISALLRLKHWDYVLFRLLERFGFDEATVSSLGKLLSSHTGTISGKSFESAQYKAITASDSVLILARQLSNCGHVSGESEGKRSERKIDGNQEGVQNCAGLDSSKGSIGSACKVSGTTLEDMQGWRLEIAGPGVYNFWGRRIIVREYNRPASLQLKRPKGQLIADSSILSFPFCLRFWKDGDYLRPLGLNGKKKLSDLFVDLKWSLPQKKAAIVLEHPDGKAGHVGALLCERIDDALKVTPFSTRIIEFEFE